MDLIYTLTEIKSAFSMFVVINMTTEEVNMSVITRHLFVLSKLLKG